MEKSKKSRHYKKRVHKENQKPPLMLTINTRLKSCLHTEEKPRLYSKTYTCFTRSIKYLYKHQILNIFEFKLLQEKTCTYKFIINYN